MVVFESLSVLVLMFDLVSAISISVSAIFKCMDVNIYQMALPYAISGICAIAITRYNNCEKKSSSLHFFPCCFLSLF
jgi:hypothetical protein